MLQQRSVQRADLVRELKAALEDPASHFFADTSFLMAAASLNASARAEFASWVANLTKARFHIPAWVAHECYGKITSDVVPLRPMEKVANDLLNAASALQAEARRFVDDKRAKEFDDRGGGRKDRVGFLAAMDQEINHLVARGRFLRAASKAEFEDASDFLVTMVNAHVLDSDIYTGLPTVEAEHAARLMGQHPPGFLDKKKEQNRYGDLIIWQEVVKHARDKEIKSVVLCTNDNKQDWVYLPPAIIDERGRHLNNEARANFKVILPLPLLQHEIRVQNPEAKLAIVNLGMLATMLHQEMQRPFPNFFAAYQPVGQVDAVQELPTIGSPEAPEPLKEAPTEPERRTSVTEVLRDIRSASAEVASAAVLAARDALVADVGIDENELDPLAWAMVEAAPRGVEAAELLVRDIINRQLAISPEIRLKLVGAMLRALYFEETGRLRDKPVEGVLNDLFSIQTQPDLRAAVDAIDVALTGHKQYYLLTPESTAPSASLTVTGRSDEAGAMHITSVLNGEHELLQDVAPDSPRSLVKIFAGELATVDQFRTALARYFRVPISQLDLNLVRSQRLAWDNLAGFVDWGARSRTILR